MMWPGKPIDFIGDQSKIFEIHFPLLDFPRRAVEELRGAADRHGLAVHIGYIMVLYLAGLRASTRRCAKLPSSTAAASGRCSQVIFSMLKPINVVVAVITVIEALRAYDIVVLSSERRGTEVMGTLVTNSLSGEGGGRVGIGSAYGMVLFMLCIGFIIWYVINNFRESES